jgi:isopentenyl-diphosphate Delta-isomerase
MKNIERRKADHIEVALEEAVGSPHNYWDDIKLVHNSLPELDIDEIDTSITLFGKKLAFPLIVTAITGGYSKAEKINKNIAEACQNLRIGMGVGSQRAALENGDKKSYSVMKEYDIPLKIGNVGAPQLVKQRRKEAFSKDAMNRALDMVDADLLGIHLNFLQEIVQPEGDTNASGCLAAMRGFAKEFPVIVKETGAGISNEVALKLKGTGIRGMDVSGTGGTSFSAVEMYRSKRMGDARGVAIGETFRDWGIPAPISVIWANVGLPLIASGGIGNGVHVAKGIVLGAKCAGVARSVLREALESPESVERKLALILEEFRGAMFLTSSRSVSELSKKDYIMTGAVKDWIAPVSK